MATISCLFLRSQTPILSLNSFLVPHYRNLKITSVECAKYHHVKKKKKLKEERRCRLEARLEKMDAEDRPTGCLLCPKQGDIPINYKNVRFLSQFVSPHTGRIYSKEATGLCQFKQNEIKKAIRQARSLGYMPYTMKYLAFHQDPRCIAKDPFLYAFDKTSHQPWQF